MPCINQKLESILTMKYFKRIFSAVFVIILLLSACTLQQHLSVSGNQIKNLQSHYHDGVFSNSTPSGPPSLMKILSFLRRSAFEEQIDNKPSKLITLNTLTQQQLDQLPDDDIYLTRLGHSSVLLKVLGEYWLIDPVFSQRASPVSFAGPKRFHPSPISLNELPPIKKVLISHNHYDHLDKKTIQQLAKKNTQFYLPLGVESNLKKWGVNQKLIKSFDWWQEEKSLNSTVIFTPTQHFSGRGLHDRDKTLWGSWVLLIQAKDRDYRIYFSGDTGYFDGFKKIGERYGPFDLTLIETGAYNKTWPDVHLFPEESVQAHIDLQGKTLLPIHNSTFDLSRHAWYEPLERISAEAQKRQIQLTTPVIGQMIQPAQSPVINQWWKEL